MLEVVVMEFGCYWALNDGSCWILLLLLVSGQLVLTDPTSDLKNWSKAWSLQLCRQTAMCAGSRRKTLNWTEIALVSSMMC